MSSKNLDISANQHAKIRPEVQASAEGVKTSSRARNGHKATEPSGLAILPVFFLFLGDLKLVFQWRDGSFWAIPQLSFFVHKLFAASTAMKLTYLFAMSMPLH